MGLIDILRFICLFTTALGAGLSLAHALQRSAKATLPSAMFLRIQQTFYVKYGPVAGMIETGSFLSCLAILFLIRGQAAAFALTLIACFSVFAMFLVWATLIQPINRQVASWKPDSMPSNWAQLGRDRWHALHMIRLVLSLVALGCLTASVLLDTSRSESL